MKRYHTLKGLSTLKRGEVVLRIPNIALLADKGMPKYDHLKKFSRESHHHPSTYYLSTTRSKSQNIKR
jgi:hypothetical protein